MLENQRYFRRSSAFEEIIARTEEHFWNPEDPDYIDFSQPLAADTPILPYEFNVEAHTAIWDRLDEGQRLDFTNDQARWVVSNLLHGEQGALSLSASLCDIFLDPGAQEYAANQVREEARHVHGFSLYAQARFGGDIFPVGDTIGNLLNDIVASPVVYKKIVGMQMLVEGIAMGAFTTLHKVALDPTLRRLCQLIMTDEAFHHRFGKIWAHSTMPDLSPEEHDAVEDWAKECFNLLMFNMVNAEQKKLIYPRYGIEWEYARDAIAEAFTDTERRETMKDSTNVFRVLTKTLDKAGIITDRTRDNYAMWVDMDELQSEGDRMVGDDLAEEGIRELVDINSTKRKIVRKLS
ncbi:MAG: ferritin-like domain-containing protein [Candidatus Binatia bacterium]|nr:ferritin-like domain-containing protein [Candidatus Binatia bacterium]